MSWDWDNHKNDFIFAEEDYGDDICPKCGSYNVRTNKGYENSDRDGNRGVWVRYIYCRDCDEEFSYNI